MRVELYVDDLDRSQAFYENVLGFITWKSEGEYRALTLQANHLAIQSITELEEDHHLRRSPGVRGLGVEVIIEVEDLPALAERVDRSGWSRTPIERRPWGLSDFRLVDPDGYYLRMTVSRAS